MAGRLSSDSERRTHQDTDAGCVTHTDLGELETTLLEQRQTIIDLRDKLHENEQEMGELRETIAQMRLAAQAFVGACDRVTPPLR